MAMRMATNPTVLERIGSARNAFANLEHWLYAPTSDTHKLHTIEVEQERRGGEVLRLMLQAHIDSRGDGCVGQAIAVRPQGSSGEIVYRHKRLRSRRLVTVLGAVSITRMEYSSPGQNSLYPLDAVLGLPARSYSYAIQRRLVKAAVKGPFDEAIEEIAEAIGVSLSKRTAEQIVADASVDFENFYQERSLRFAPDSGPLLIASVNGKGVPMVKSASGERKVRLARGEKRNKKRMSTVGAVFTQKPNIRTPEAVVESLFAESLKPHPTKHYHRPEQKRVWASLLFEQGCFHRPSASGDAAARSPAPENLDRGDRRGARLTAQSGRHLPKIRTDPGSVACSGEALGHQLRVPTGGQPGGS